MWLLVLINLAGKIAALLLARSAPGTAIACWFVPDALLAYHLFAPTAQGLVRTHRRFATTAREVWLTIDDGPDPDDTPRILALLAAHEARATFFVIGEAAARHPELIRRIVAAGHEIAHHTHTHPLATFWCASPARTARELDHALTTFRLIGIPRPTRFRPPAGIRNLWLAPALRRRALACIGWSARGFERRTGDAARVADRVMRDVRPGAILLLHEGARLPAAVRVNAISHVLDRLRAAGYRCVVPDSAALLTH